MTHRVLHAVAALALSGATLPAIAQTAPGFHLRVFATAPANTSAPDSIIVVGNTLWVGFGNGAAKDGSSGSSTVVEYTPAGSIVRQVTIPGHNDGLRLDPTSGMLVALQNEDANPTIAYINPANGAVTAPIPLKSLNGGGGFDDMAFVNGRMFTSASNPTLDAKGINHAPAIAQIIATGRGYTYQTLLEGDANAIDAVSDTPVRLNLTDPDSLTVTPDGSILMTDQQDSQLVLVRVGRSKGPFVTRVPLLSNVQVDDTVFATASTGTLYMTDTGANEIFAITSQRFQVGKPYSASTGVPASGGIGPVPPFVGQLYLDTGAIVPIAGPNGFMTPHGLAFRAQ